MRPPKLPDVFARPALDGKRLPGEIEIHQNGLRYRALGGQKIGLCLPSRQLEVLALIDNTVLDLLFANIKHLFFQPCDQEMLVIIHCHLKAPIMIGKKKTKVASMSPSIYTSAYTVLVSLQDVQFYREASEVQFDETGNRKRKYRYGDEDEIELEQAERKRRQGLNREFKYFAEKIANAVRTVSLRLLTSILTARP